MSQWRASAQENARRSIIAPAGATWRHGWPEPAIVAGLAILGIAAGVAAKAADESTVRWAADLGTYPASWVLALALIARFAPGMVWAATRTAAFFVATVLAYYGWAWFALGFGVDRYLILWLGLAVTFVPVGAALVQWAMSHRGPLPGLVLATLAASAVADRLLWQLWWAWVLDAAPEGFPLRPFQAFVGAAVAIVIAGVLPRHRRTRLWVLVLLIPTAILVTRIIDHVMSTLLRFV
jgi:hypothetical protein